MSCCRTLRWSCISLLRTPFPNLRDCRLQLRCIRIEESLCLRLGHMTAPCIECQHYTHGSLPRRRTSSPFRSWALFDLGKCCACLSRLQPPSCSARCHRSGMPPNMRCCSRRPPGKIPLRILNCRCRRRPAEPCHTSRVDCTCWAVRNRHSSSIAMCNSSRHSGPVHKTLGPLFARMCLSRRT